MLLNKLHLMPVVACKVKQNALQAMEDELLERISHEVAGASKNFKTQLSSQSASQTTKLEGLKSLIGRKVGITIKAV